MEDVRPPLLWRWTAIILYIRRSKAAAARDNYCCLFLPARENRTPTKNKPFISHDVIHDGNTIRYYYCCVSQQSTKQKIIAMPSPLPLFPSIIKCLYPSRPLHAVGVFRWTTYSVLRWINRSQTAGKTYRHQELAPSPPACVKQVWLRNLADTTLSSVVNNIPLLSAFSSKQAKIFKIAPSHESQQNM